MLRSYFVGYCRGIKRCVQLVSGHWEHWEQKSLSKFDIKSTWHYKTKPLIWSFILIASTCRSKQILRRLVPLRQKMVLLLISSAPCERKLNECDEHLHPASPGKRSASLPICTREASSQQRFSSLVICHTLDHCMLISGLRRSLLLAEPNVRTKDLFMCFKSFGTTSSTPEKLICKCHKKRKCFQII